jgi:hypothetical protein
MPQPGTVERWAASGDLTGRPRSEWVKDVIDVAVIGAVAMLVLLIAIL